MNTTPASTCRLRSSGCCGISSTFCLPSPADPTLPIAAIPILDASERRHLVVECNDTAAAYPRDLTLPHLFARQAAETPGAIAVVAGAQSLTYREVEQRSDALARQLMSRGFGPNARVGVFVNRTADLVIAPLAILKAGNAYVPLDPTYPPGRLTQIIEQSGLVAIIAQSAVVPPPLRSVPIVAIGEHVQAGDNGRHASAAFDPSGGHRLRHFHLRLDRPTERRADSARRADQLSVRHARGRPASRRRTPSSRLLRSASTSPRWSFSFHSRSAQRS